MWKILETLWGIRPGSQRTNLLRPLEYLYTRLQTASLLFCISDFIAQEEVLTSHTLQRLTRRHDFIPVILEDELEAALPRARGYLRLRDAEAGGDLLFRLSDRTRGKYESLVRAGAMSQALRVSSSACNSRRAVRSHSFHLA